MKGNKNIFSLGEAIAYIKRLKHLADLKYGAFSRFFQFCLVGGTGMVVDLVMYYVLLKRAGIPLMFSRGIAIWTAMTWNFWLNRRVTFSYSRDKQIFSQYLKFLLSCSLGAVLSWSVAVGFALWTDYFENHVFIAAIIGILLGTICNFALSALWVFRHKTAATQDVGEKKM